MEASDKKPQVNRAPLLGAAWLPQVDETMDPQSDYYKRHVLPIDHGWAWVICFAGFLVYFTFGIATQVLVVELTEISAFYEASLTATSLIFMFGVFSVGFMSILSTNWLAPRFGERAVVTTAGVFNMCGSLGLAFAPTIYYFLMCSVVKGFATGAVFVPSISLIRMYFTKKRSIALIIANIGQSAAIIISPYIITLIRKKYGLPGTFIVCAGFELHMCLAGLLLRPVSAYTYRPRTEHSTDAKALHHVLVSEDYNELTFTEKHKNVAQNLKLLKLRLALDRDGNSTTRLPRFSRIPSKSRQSRLFSHLPSQDKSEMTLATGTDGSFDQNTETATDPAVTAPNLNENHDENLKATDDNSIDEKEEIKLRQQKRFRKCMFHLIILANIPASANLYIRSYIPTIMQGQGATVQESALLLTISGLVDLISRLGVGLFADTQILTAAEITIISQLCLAAVCHSIEFFSAPYYMWIVYVVLQGLFIGTRASMLPLLIMEVMGVENMPQYMAIVCTAAALASAPMHPMFGAITEAWGSFYMALHIMGGCFTFAALVLLFMPYVSTFCCGPLPPEPEPEEPVDQAEEIKKEKAISRLYKLRKGTETRL